MATDPGERLEWLISLPQAELLDLLALCVAFSLDAVTGRDEARRADDLAEAVGLNMSDWWVASADSYLRHVSKAQIVDALREAGCDPSEREVMGLRKDALVTVAATRLAGTSWLPAQLRAGPIR
jgi:ParB family chromosome partitioning protein